MKKALSSQKQQKRSVTLEKDPGDLKKREIYIYVRDTDGIN